MVNKVCTHCLLYGLRTNETLLMNMVKLVVQGELN